MQPKGPGLPMDDGHASPNVARIPARQAVWEARAELALISNLLVDAQDRIGLLESQNAWLRATGGAITERGKWWWSFMPRRWQVRKRDRRLLRRGLFDREAYERRYPDVVASGLDPLRHYMLHGIAENRQFD